MKPTLSVNTVATSRSSGKHFVEIWQARTLHIPAGSSFISLILRQTTSAVDTRQNHCIIKQYDRHISNSTVNVDTNWTPFTQRTQALQIKFIWCERRLVKQTCPATSFVAFQKFKISSAWDYQIRVLYVNHNYSCLLMEHSFVLCIVSFWTHFLNTQHFDLRQGTRILVLAAC